MPAGVGKTETREKGRKNVVSSDKGNGKKKACTDVNFMGFRIPTGVGQDETRAKGKKNMASSDKGKGKKGISGSPAAYNSSPPVTSSKDKRSRNDIYGVQSSRDNQ
ncbi:hypothetical protein FCV25MIE_09598 [Fagus crenata]